VFFCSGEGFPDHTSSRFARVVHLLYFGVPLLTVTTRFRFAEFPVRKEDSDGFECCGNQVGLIGLRIRQGYSLPKQSWTPGGNSTPVSCPCQVHSSLDNMRQPMTGSPRSGRFLLNGQHLPTGSAGTSGALPAGQAEYSSSGNLLDPI